MTLTLGILRERRKYETRVAATPDTIKKYVALGCRVLWEQGAGSAASYTDEAAAAAGATIADLAHVVGQSDIILKVQRPLSAAEDIDELAGAKAGAMVVGILNPYGAEAAVRELAGRQLTAFAMELMPRITRAQNMDVLSSQSNLAGYRAVLEASHAFGRALPMMMTAAGTVAPAKVMVMGAGVAGLQAIATAKRLGAVVCATDVRPAAKEQVESLGGSFVMVEDAETKQAETAGGYAKEMSADYQARQAALIAETIKKQDMVICTALIPGRAAPRLVSRAMVESMRPGSVVLDLAVEQGGNCELSKLDETVNHRGVKILGIPNMPGRIATDASALYARNLLNFVTFMLGKDKNLASVNWNDEIMQAVTLCRDGQLVHPLFKPKE